MQDYPDIMKNIKRKYNNLSKSHKIIATYILKSYDKAAFLTASDLAKSTGVSESTVVRFSLKLGFEGYRELQNELQEFIKTKLTTVQRLNLLNDNFENKKNIITSIMETDMDNIKKIINNIDYSSFKKAITLMLEAKQIYVIGLRSSYFLAGYLNFYLNFLLDNVKLISIGPNDLFEQLLKMSSEDIILVITYPRYSQMIMEVLEYSKEKKTPIITITDSLISPAAQKADVTLIAPSDMLSFVDSLVAPMSLINALIIALGIEKKEDLSNYFGELENIWEKYNTYNTIDL